MLTFLLRWSAHRQPHHPRPDRLGRRRQPIPLQRSRPGQRQRPDRRMPLVRRICPVHGGMRHHHGGHQRGHRRMQRLGQHRQGLRHRLRRWNGIGLVGRPRFQMAKAGVGCAALRGQQLSRRHVGPCQTRRSESKGCKTREIQAQAD